MTIAMYQASAPDFARTLANPRAILDRAAARAILRHNGVVSGTADHLGSFD